MFKVGTRVEVTDEKEARRTGANVRLGDRGVILKTEGLGKFRLVIIDRDPAKHWSIPAKGLTEIKEEA